MYSRARVRSCVCNCQLFPSPRAISTAVFMLQTFKFLLEYTRNADSSQISDWEVYVALVSGLVQAVIAVMSWMSVRLPPYLHQILCDHAVFIVLVQMGTPSLLSSAKSSLYCYPSVVPYARSICSCSCSFRFSKAVRK
jgi:hypothetical protein